MRTISKFKSTSTSTSTSTTSKCLQTASLLCALLLPAVGFGAVGHIAPADQTASLYDSLTHGRFYVSGRVGFVGGESVKYGNEVGDPVSLLFQDIHHYQRGRSAGLALGYAVGRIRVELAGNYSENRLESIDTGATIDLSGDEKNLGAHIINVVGRSQLTDILLNFYLDFKNSSRFTPFVGFGLGAVYDKQHSFSVLPAVILNLKRREFLDEDWAFAYQGKVGFNYLFSPHILVGLEARYLVVDSTSFQGKEFLVTMPDLPSLLKKNQKAARLNRSIRFQLTYLFGDI